MTRSLRTILLGAIVALGFRAAYPADGTATFVPGALGEFGYEFAGGSGYRPYFFIDIPATSPGTTCTGSPRRIFVKVIPWVSGTATASTQYYDQVLATFDNYYATAQVALSMRKQLSIGYDCDANRYTVLPIDATSPYAFAYWMTILK